MPPPSSGMALLAKVLHFDAWTSDQKESLLLIGIEVESGHQNGIKNIDQFLKLYPQVP